MQTQMIRVTNQNTNITFNFPTNGRHGIRANIQKKARKNDERHRKGGRKEYKIR